MSDKYASLNAIAIYQKSSLLKYTGMYNSYYELPSLPLSWL